MAEKKQWCTEDDLSKSTHYNFVIFCRIFPFIVFCSNENFKKEVEQTNFV